MAHNVPRVQNYKRILSECDAGAMMHGLICGCTCVCVCVCVCVFACSQMSDAGMCPHVRPSKVTTHATWRTLYSRVRDTNIQTVCTLLHRTCPRKLVLAIRSFVVRTPTHLFVTGRVCRRFLHLTTAQHDFVDAVATRRLHQVRRVRMHSTFRVQQGRFCVYDT